MTLIAGDIVSVMKNFQIRLTDEEYDLLQQRANQYGISKQQLFKLLILKSDIFRKLEERIETLEKSNV